MIRVRVIYDQHEPGRFTEELRKVAIAQETNEPVKIPGLEGEWYIEKIEQSRDFTGREVFVQAIRSS